VDGGELGGEIQVRAQEMVFASQRVDEFRERKLEDKNKLLNHLKVYLGRFYPPVFAVMVVCACFDLSVLTFQVC
jgi:hypothetical protein